MKRFILFFIAIFCINGFTSTIEAKPQNNIKICQKYLKRVTKRNTRKVCKHNRRDKNYGRFKSVLTGKTLKGHQSLSYINTHKKKCY
jgi:hypothetical protein